MDAVEKAAEALREAGWRRWVSSPTGADADRVHRETRERIARAVLDAVAPHESSDEGTCWCPAAEQAGRERDAARAVRDQLRDALVTIAAMRQEADDWDHPDFDWRVLARKQEKAARDALDREMS